MKIVIRADASLEMGTGHVMRCLTLADALSEKGNDVAFICRKHPGNLIQHIQAKGYRVYILEISDGNDFLAPKIEHELTGELSHAKWLGVSQEIDASDCKQILNKIKPEWLVVDHYAIDKTWQELLKGSFQKLMVVDDLADRHHACHLLLDQTYGRSMQEYEGLVPDTCKLMLGAEYALLRPEFAEWREFSLKRRIQSEFKNLLITMGGVDPNNITGQVLEALKTCDLPRDIEITVVMGDTAPHIKDVRVLADSMQYKTEVKVNVSNMAEIMANSDLAIGASGSTTWERCCLGLPSILFVLADNQLFTAEKLQNLNIVSIVKSDDELKNKINTINFDLLSRKSFEVTNGTGVNKVLGEIND